MPSVLTTVAALLSLACWACAGLGRRVPTSSVRTYEISQRSYEEQRSSWAPGDGTDRRPAVNELMQPQSSRRVHVLHRLKVLGMLLLALNNMAAGWHVGGYLSALGPVAKTPAGHGPKSRSASLTAWKRWDRHFYDRILQASRTRGATMREKELDELERRALAGVWSGRLDLDDGLQMATCQFSPSGACTVATTGPMSSSSKCAWDARLDLDSRSEAEANSLTVKVWFGDLMMQGVGTRDPESLRCTSVSGFVLEGGEEPVYVGRFELTLTLPEVEHDELVQLAAQRKARLDARPRPARFRLGAFVGRWKLLVAFDTKTLLFTVQLGKDGKFTSVDSLDNRTLAGSWGVFGGHRRGDPSVSRKLNYGFGTDMPQLGTHLLMRVERRKCVGLPIMHQSFSLWGKPGLDTPKAALIAKSASGSGYADSVDGYCYLGASSDRDWFVTGRFSLQRAT